MGRCAAFRDSHRQPLDVPDVQLLNNAASQCRCGRRPTSKPALLVLWVSGGRLDSFAWRRIVLRCVAEGLFAGALAGWGQGLRMYGMHVLYLKFMFFAVSLCRCVNVGTYNT